jgi:hypothetical protein
MSLLVLFVCVWLFQKAVIDNVLRDTEYIYVNSVVVLGFGKIWDVSKVLFIYGLSFVLVGTQKTMKF